MTALYICFHCWHGFARYNLEPELFHWVVKAGFVTVYIEKKSLLDAYRKLRATIVDAVGKEPPR